MDGSHFVNSEGEHVPGGTFRNKVHANLCKMRSIRSGNNVIRASTKVNKVISLTGRYVVVILLEVLMEEEPMREIQLKVGAEHTWLISSHVVSSGWCSHHMQSNSMKQFQTKTKVEVIPDRCLQFILNGHDGELHVFGYHFAHGSTEENAADLRKIKRCIQPAATVLTMMGLILMQ